MSVLQIILEGVDSASGVIDGVGGALDGLAGVASGALTAGFAVAAAGAAGLAAGLGVSLAAAMDNEKIQANLAQVIKSTGGAAGLTAEKANELATQFKGLSGGSDDAILAIETVGLRAGTVSAEQMPAFIQSTLDLGAVMGDTTAAAQLLARAQDDPIAAFKRIERATGSYDSALEDQIKKLQDAGDTAGATALIMGKLSETTGGAAAAQADTLAGQWEIMQGTLGEAAETIGMALLPVARELFDNVIKPAIPVIEDLAFQFGDLIQNIVSGNWGGVADDIQFVFDILAGKDMGDSVGGAMQGISDALQGVVGFIQGTLIPALQVMVGWVQEHWPEISAIIGQVIGFVQELITAWLNEVVPFWTEQFSKIVAWVQENMPLIQETIQTVLTAIKAFWDAHGEQIIGVVTFLFDTIKGLISGALDLILGIVKAGMQIINGDWSGAWETIKTTVKTIWDGISTWFGTALAGIGTAIRAIDWGALGSSIIQGIANGISAGASAIADAARSAAQAALDAAKAALGIHSPSTAFAGVGVNMMLGMAQGINAGSGAAQGAMTGAAHELVQNTYQTTFNVSNYGSSPEENTSSLQAWALAGAW